MWRIFSQEPWKYHWLKVSKIGIDTSVSKKY